MTSNSLKMAKVVILSENRCHFVSCSACKISCFLSQLEISHVLNGTTPKNQHRNEEHSVFIWFKEYSKFQKIVYRVFWVIVILGFFLCGQNKGGLILECILTLVPLPTKGAKHLPGPEQKVWITCLLKRAGNSNLLLMGEIWHLLLTMQ